MARRKMQNKSRWCLFFGGLIIFAIGVELWHRYSQEGDLVYQFRIPIDEDFSVEEASSDEEAKSERISLYTRTKYGVLPRKQSDPAKIFNAYSANIECKGSYVKVAILVEDATEEKIQSLVAQFPNTKVSFIIPHYANNLNRIAEIIISSGHEFFIQLPTQSSIPLDKKNRVSPFLANASADEVREKLSYLISSVKYAIGVANTSKSLVTKSRKDMEVISQELSQRGMAFLNIKDDSSIEEEISDRIKLLSFHAKVFEKSGVLKEKDSIMITSDQINDLKVNLPKNLTIVPISFGTRNASV